MAGSTSFSSTMRSTENLGVGSWEMGLGGGEERGLGRCDVRGGEGERRRGETPS